MTIQLFNTQTRCKEAFTPLDPAGRRVTIYNCGPTVYDHFHIGNARNFVVMDVVRRYFEYRGFEVVFVQNLTDIDDKIINRANADGVPTEKITERFIAAYFEDAGKLGIQRATHHPCATQHVPEIVALIERLVARGTAYAANGSVYFRVSAFPGYGKLSGRRVEDMLEGARVEVSDEKEAPADFALWKAVKPGEPSWESPWGPGRPGWHIECSAMSMAILGETIDIHAGGVDLTFPHHENELAQSEAATGQPFVRYWMHNGFLNIDSEKMSKSLGNFLKIDQILEKWPAHAVRHFLLSAHYRSPLDLTPEAVNQSASAVNRINDAIDTATKVLELEGFTLQSGGAPTDAMRERFEQAMDDDFNTPKALAVLFDAVTAIHEARQMGPGERPRLAALAHFALQLRDFFGLAPAQPEAAAQQGDGLTEPLMALLIEARAAARKAKAFEVADLIRNRLGELGLALEDHPQGTIWKRKDG